MNKYRKELKKYREYKKNFKYDLLEVIKKEENSYLDGILIKNKDGMIGESDKWINVGYSLKGKYPKLLSNLFPYRFKFRGYTLNSIECFFQGIKFKSKKMQKKIFKYSGKDALVLGEVSDYNWKESGYVYFMGKKILRDSKEYDDIIDELYISAIQNDLYRSAIKNCKLPIVHIMGEDSKKDTTFTRHEFEFMLNSLRSFLQN